MALDMPIILDKLEAFGLLRQSKQVGNYMQIYCPFHNDGNEKKPSCGVLLTDEMRGGRLYPAGFTHCFSCGFAKPIEQTVNELLKIHHIEKSAVEWLTENIPGYEYEAGEADMLLPSGMFEGLVNRYAVDYISSFKSAQIPYVTEEELAKYRFTVPYMYERKLTDELIIKFDIGYDANWIPPGRKKPVPCITFPVRDRSGKTLFFCRRSIQGKLFNYPQGVTKPVYGLYELPKDIKSVVICESCFNALTSWRYGRPAVALLGTGNSYQIQQLKELGVKEFILGFDPDEAGQKATVKLKKALHNVAIVWQFTGIPLGKDINDLTEEEFNALDLE